MSTTDTVSTNATISKEEEIPSNISQDITGILSEDALTNTEVIGLLEQLENSITLGNIDVPSTQTRLDELGQQVEDVDSRLIVRALLTLVEMSETEEYAAAILNAGALNISLKVLRIG